MKKTLLYSILFAALVLLTAYPFLEDTELASCLAYFSGGVRDVAADRSERFLGKVHQDTIRCRGGNDAAPWRATPWLDWQRYWGAGDTDSKYTGLLSGLGFLSPNHRGIGGALLDLEYQRIELLKFNLFDNSGTFKEYVREGQSDGKLERIWPQFRLPKNHPFYAKIGGDGAQKCSGELIRFRTLDGICNDIMNPLMGATGQPFARNVDFYNSFRN